MGVDSAASEHASFEERLSELELRWMQEKSRVDELSELVWQQSRTIEALERSLGSLRGQLAAGPGDPVVNETPPHY